MTVINTRRAINLASTSKPQREEDTSCRMKNEAHISTKVVAFSLTIASQVTTLDCTTQTPTPNKLKSWPPLELFSFACILIWALCQYSHLNGSDGQHGDGTYFSYSHAMSFYESQKSRLSTYCCPQLSNQDTARGAR